MWSDGYYDDGDYWVTGGDDGEDKCFEWYDGYKKWKAHKTQIKEKLLSIVWHPSIRRDWCVSEDDKKETEKLLE